MNIESHFQMSIFLFVFWSSKTKTLTCSFVPPRMVIHTLCILIIRLIYYNSLRAIVADIHGVHSIHHPYICMVVSKAQLSLYHSKSNNLCQKEMIALPQEMFEATNITALWKLVKTPKKILTFSVDVLGTGSICLLSNFLGFKIQSCSGAIEFHKQHGNHNATPTSTKRNTISCQFLE